TGLVKRASHIEALAGALGLPPISLGETLAEYLAGRSTGADRFGRTSFADMRPPFFGLRVTAALFHTQGGLKVDRYARVIRRNGSPVPNLYAGGGVAAGISGHGPGGYLPGA